MAVLGKRSRNVAEANTPCEAPVAKRRTRRSAPQIYEDEAEPSSQKALLKTNAPEIRDSPKTRGRGRHDRKKCIVQNAVVKNPPDTLQLPQNESLALLDNSEVTNENSAPLSAFSTPSTLRFKDVFATGAPSTPKQRVRLAGRLLTPRSSRTTPSTSQNVYAQARQLFTQAGDAKIIGREAERQQLTSSISTAIEKQIGQCIYVSGPPGTGKSALVHEVLEGFRGTGSVKVAEINCVALKSAAEVLAKLGEEFAATTTSRKSTKSDLAKLFTATRSGGPLHLVLLDEIDSLLTGECEVLYSMFEWAMHPSSSLILIGIANALDLTERFLPRMKQKNLRPEVLPFLPYSAQQISAILSEKLRSLLPAESSVASDFIPLMHPAAIQLSGKKIASQTGDLRKAFSLVRRAIDQVEQETLLKMNRESSMTPTKQPLAELSNMARQHPSAADGLSEKVLTPKKEQRTVLSQLSLETAPRATIAHVARIAASIFNNSTLSRLGGLNLQQKAVLCSLVASEKGQSDRGPYSTPSKTWAKLPTIKGLFEKYAMLCKRDDGLLQPLKNTEFRDVVASLETLGLVHESTGRSSGLLTPTSTPSRSGRGLDDRAIVSAVSEKEMRDGISGPGAELLLRLLDEY